MPDHQIARPAVDEEIREHVHVRALHPGTHRPEPRLDGGIEPPGRQRRAQVHLIGLGEVGVEPVPIGRQQGDALLLARRRILRQRLGAIAAQMPRQHGRAMSQAAWYISPIALSAANFQLPSIFQRTTPGAATRSPWSSSRSSPSACRPGIPRAMALPGRKCRTPGPCSCRSAPRAPGPARAGRCHPCTVPSCPERRSGCPWCCMPSRDTNRRSSGHCPDPPDRRGCHGACRN